MEVSRASNTSDSKTDLARSRSRYKGHRPERSAAFPLNTKPAKVEESRCRPQDVEDTGRPSRQHPPKSNELRALHSFAVLGNQRDRLQEPTSSRPTTKRLQKAATPPPDPHISSQNKPSTSQSAKRISQVQSPLANADKLSEVAAIPGRTRFGKPAFDAPISAVNAGERTVAVQYEKSILSIPFTPHTTVTDLVDTVSTQVGTMLDAGATTVLESFKQLGLERPLRRYERIRSVLNSWDHDSQNALILAPAAEKSRELDVQDVASQQVQDISLQIYHSQRLRHWDKVDVTLRSDGQISSTKKGVTSNICHVSDFDIYKPTKRQLSKKIKPPKKICFAIKSQQKYSMFLSTENFVHFFSTSDKNLGAQWYSAVQKWRSWYLVNIMGEGRDRPSEIVSPTGLQLHSHRPAKGGWKDGLLENMKAPTSHEPPLSTLNSRSDFGEVGQGTDASILQQSPRQDRIRVSGNPSLPVPATPTVRQPFTSTGLLGRTYTQRKKAQGERMDAGGGMDVGPTTAKAAAAPKQISLPLPSPLVDLTPQYQEPPQFRRGKGVTPERMPAGGLVEVATSPENAFPIPPSITWRRPQDGSPGPRRSGTVSQYQQDSKPRRGRKQESSSPEKTVFDTGLLALETSGQGDLGHGKGFRTGDRHAKTPLMDLREGSRYAPGSLLAQAERYDGGDRRPVIEREKKKELDVTVGEAR